MDLSLLSPRLRQNQDTSLRVVLTHKISSSALTEWIAALQVNESVKHVEVLCSGGFLQKATAGQWRSLLGTLLGLPNLQSFQLRGCSTASSCYNQGIPMEAFSALRSRHLTVFSLSQLVLCGGSRDLQRFTNQWKAQKALRSFQLISIGLDGSEHEDVTTSTLLGPLFNVLADLPKLENLEVSGTFTPLGVLEQAPQRLFQSKSLKRLSISDVIFPAAALSSTWQDLSKNFTLKELAISGDLTREVAPKLTRLLEHNKTLEAISLRVDNFNDEVCNQELVKAIGGSHLQAVSLCNFFGGSLSVSTRNAFAKMLKMNCSLEYLYVPCPYTDRSFWHQVRLYLGLNVAGRKRAMKTKQRVGQEEEEKKEDASEQSRRAFYWMANKTASSAAPLSPKRTSSKPTISLAQQAAPPGKRHQQMIHEARLDKKRRLQVIPTKGLSSMFIR